MGFGGAALSLTPLMLMTPRKINGQPVAGAPVTIPISFIFPGDSAREIGGKAFFQVSTAIWLKSPSAAVVAASFPKAAAGKSGTGHVVLGCSFTKDGLLRDCAVVQEVPKGQGFGKSALELTKKFQANTASFGDHKPDAVVIRFPIHFIDPATADWQSRAIAKPQWTDAPTVKTVAEAFPSQAKAAGIKSGLGRVECTVGSEGRLADCQTISESPTGLGFGDAALKLAGDFAMNSWTAEGLPVDGIRVALPIRLVDDPAPTTPTKP